MRIAIWSFLALAAASSVLPAQSLDFNFYRTRVEPIFITKRPEHTRCVVCHSGSKHAFNLEKLAPGATTFTAEQSRRNFEMASRLVVPGKPESSMLLLHPLAHSGGGDQFHSGGRQFRSKTDPEWKALAEWVNQGKPAR